MRRIQVLQAIKPASQFIGRLPIQLHLAILTYLFIPDVARYARACRPAPGRVASNERLWELRWLDLTVERLKLGHILNTLESKVDRAGEQSSISSGPATIAVSALEDDDFGDFESASTASNAPATQLPLDLGFGDTGAIFKSESTPTLTFRRKYIRAHTLLAPFVPGPHLNRILDAVSPRPRERRSTSSRASSPPSSSPPLHGTSARCCSRPPSTDSTRGC